MIIQSITAQTITIPLIKTFKTALRTLDEVDYIHVRVRTRDGNTGIGGAAPSVVITGESTDSILGAVGHIQSRLRGMDLQDRNHVFHTLNQCMVGNASAKAAVDMALYDLAAKTVDMPLFSYLGGGGKILRTDYTVGLDTLDRMEKESRALVQKGFNTLKVKVGHDSGDDIQRLLAVSRAAGPDILLRIDANQGWTPKQALTVADAIEKHQINVQLMEQPVQAHDIKGLAHIRRNTRLPVFADESLFSPMDALRLLDCDAVDGFNIKLMKCGGIYNALKITGIAETAGIPCMIGSMMESNVSVTAAAHLACASRVIRYCDLDAPLFCKDSPVPGGLVYHKDEIKLPPGPGLGFGEPA